MAFVAVLALRTSLPPKSVAMTTGIHGGAYEAFGQRYRTILARSNVELRLTPSAGGAENLNRLNDPRSGVSVGFAEGGLTDEQQSPELMSLGTVFYEPIWLFYRGMTLTALQHLQGKKLSIGREGSATRALALRLLALNGIDQNFAQFVSLSAADAAAALQKGEIDAAVVVASWDEAAVRRLLASSDIELASYPRADAYVALYPFLTKLTLPAGVGNLAANRPPVSVSLIASKASLIVRKDLHPAIQNLLLEAASEIHAGAGIFQKAGQFPAPEQVDLPLSRDATQFYKSGPPFLMRTLPFWLAVLVGSWFVLLIPLVGLVFPLLRLAPAVYDWNMQRRISGLYRELQRIEVELEAHGGHAPEDLRARLDRLEVRADHMSLPVSFAHLCMHIGLVRARLQQLPQGDAPRPLQDLEPSASSRRSSEQLRS